MTGKAIERRSFYAFLKKQELREGIIGRMAREALGTGRHFTCWSITEWMLAGYTGPGLDVEHDAVAQLVSEYESERDEVLA